jgi:hypothetical protein
VFDYTSEAPQRPFIFLEHEHFMRKLFIAAVVALGLPIALAGQDAAQIIKDYSKQMASDEVSLNLIHLNAKTVPVLFQPPMLYSMRARAQQQTMIYVQTVIEVNGELDTSNFVLEQGGESTPGTPTSINNFTKGKLRLRLGDKVDGILSFPKMVDVTKPFTVRHGLDKAEFRFNEAQVKALEAPAPAAPAAQ